jgi:methylmalonyl-CoA mutase C-terminal domain/subunit
MEKKIRVLLAKVGLDGHDRGILMVACALRDAGMEVIYTGLHQTPEQVAHVAVQEGVDIVGVGSHADAHNTLMPKVIAELRKAGLDIPVILGGFIQPEDVPELKAIGVTEVFGINTRLGDIPENLKKIVANREKC